MWDLLSNFRNSITAYQKCKCHILQLDVLMLSSRMFLFDSTSIDELLVLYICIYELCFLYCFYIRKTHVCSSLLEEIKNFIIIIIIIDKQS